MQAIFETLFDLVYLTLVITLGIRMIRGADGRRQDTLYGILAVTLGCGDAFHLVPRAVALCTTGLENYTAALGIGKLITSITMAKPKKPAMRFGSCAKAAADSGVRALLMEAPFFRGGSSAFLWNLALVQTDRKR